MQRYLIIFYANWNNFHTKTNFDVSCVLSVSLFAGLALSLLTPILLLPFFLFDCGVFIFSSNLAQYITNNHKRGYTASTLDLRTFYLAFSTFIPNPYQYVNTAWIAAFSIFTQRRPLQLL